MAVHYGYCNKCQKLAPAAYEERGSQVLLVKTCPDCGATETIVSTDAPEWRAKRQIARLDNDLGCALNCGSCEVKHSPTTVFVDITNRCNQDCPICIANVPGMGFKFEPPFEYFQKLFTYLAGLNPKPSIKLFGGEPTVRKDLIDIVNLARGMELSTSIVTNGLRLADEDYCRQLLATNAKLIFAFDGRDPAVYQKLRGDARIYETKLKALENIRKHRKGKITIMCVVAKGINDHLIGDLFQFCHERTDFITALEFIPLTRTWAPGTVEADGADITAMEDAEKLVGAGVPGGRLEYLPAGLTPFKTIGKYLPVPRLTFAGAHPNCESVSFLVSNGTEYVPVNQYLKGRSLYQSIEEVVALDERLGERIAKMQKGVFGKLGMGNFRARLMCLKGLGGVLWRRVDTRAIFGRNAGWKMLKVGFGLLMGRQAKKVLRANTRLQTVLRVVILPFEEPRTLDSAKLKRCPAAFAYEDPETRQPRTMPVCSWGLYKDKILKQIMDNYAAGHAAGSPKTTAASRT